MVHTEYIVKIQWIKRGSQQKVSYMVCRFYCCSMVELVSGLRIDCKKTKLKYNFVAQMSERIKKKY